MCFIFAIYHTSGIIDENTAGGWDVGWWRVVVEREVRRRVEILFPKVKRKYIYYYYSVYYLYNHLKTIKLLSTALF